MEQGTIRLKTGLAEMLKGGVIMDVTTPEQAKIAEEAGACAVMALERVPADIRAAGGVSPSSTSRRMPPPTAVVMPIMATPNRSMPFRAPSAAPEMAKATTPIISK